MVDLAPALLAVSTGNALLAGGLAARLFTSAHRLGGMPPAVLAGVGFTALAATSLLRPPSGLAGFDLVDAARLFLSLVGFAAIALGYLLHLRHGDLPERGFAMAYAAFLAALAAALGPFVAVAAFYPVLRSWDHVVYWVSAALALGVAAHLGRARAGHPPRGAAAAGFVLLAGNQAVLSLAVLDWTPLEPLLLLAAVLRMGGLGAFAFILLRPRGDTG